MDTTSSSPPDADADNNRGTLRRHDLVVSVILLFVSVLLLLDSLRMTFGIDLPGIEENVWLVAPGFLPMILSGGLVLMFSALILISIRQGDIKGHFSLSAILQAVTDRETIMKLLQIVWLCLFVFLLLGRLHFGVASALYLFSAMATARAAKLWQVTFISVIFAAAITYVFGTLMKIPLP